MLFDPGCSDCGCEPPDDTTILCGGCLLPKADLVLTYTNSLLGSRSIAMVFDGVDEWVTACENEIAFRLRCVSGVLSFAAAYFAGGHCPTGEPVICSNSGSPPFGLELTSSSCDPLRLVFGATSCPTLSIQGYTEFVITGDGLSPPVNCDFGIEVRGCFGELCKRARIGDPEVISSPPIIPDGEMSFTLNPGTSVTLHVWHPGYADPIVRTFSCSSSGVASWGDGDTVFTFAPEDLAEGFICPLWHRTDSPPPGDPWKLPLLVTDAQSVAEMDSGTLVSECVERAATRVGATCEPASVDCGGLPREYPPTIADSSIELTFSLAGEGGGGHLGGDVWSIRMRQHVRIGSLLVYDPVTPCGFSEATLMRSWYCPTSCEAAGDDERRRWFPSGLMTIVSYSPLAATFAWPSPVGEAWGPTATDTVTLEPPPGAALFSSTVLSDTPY